MYNGICDYCIKGEDMKTRERKKFASVDSEEYTLKEIDFLKYVDEYKTFNKHRFLNNIELFRLTKRFLGIK